MDEQILQIDNLPKAKIAYNKAVKRVLGDTSLVAIGGEHWKKLRKMFNPAFAPNHLEMMIPAIIKESEVFVKKLSQAAAIGEIVRMNELTTVISLCW